MLMQNTINAASPQWLYLTHHEKLSMKPHKQNDFALCTLALFGRAIGVLLWSDRDRKWCGRKELGITWSCERATCVSVCVSGQGALGGAVAPVPVSASSSSVPALLRHHPLQGVVVQAHAAARAPVHQAGRGATHGTRVRDGL